MTEPHGNREWTETSTQHYMENNAFVRLDGNICETDWKTQRGTSWQDPAMVGHKVLLADWLSHYNKSLHVAKCVQLSSNFNQVEQEQQLQFVTTCFRRNDNCFETA